MHKVIINKLGPIDHVELECNEFMVFTGAQASGKSTIAKAIFFFRSIKDDILSLMIKKISSINSDRNSPLHNMFIAEIREKFMRVFGSSWGMDNDMYMEYQYNDDVRISICLKEEPVYTSPNYIWAECSKAVLSYLYECNTELTRYNAAIPEEEKDIIKNRLNQLFSDPFDSIYIPAGRSMITLFATQLNYIYSTMEDAQKRAIDFCTRNYLERILRIRPEFENGLQGVVGNYPTKARKQPDTLGIAEMLISNILKGSYKYNNGDERLELTDNHYVKINFMSSGQQEVVWFLNLLFYQLLQNKPTFFIIEEPESHLFPEAQKAVSEFIAFVKNKGNSMLVTTHSPYILGSINNLLYAGSLPRDSWDEAMNIINKRYWIDYTLFNAWFVQDGHIDNAMDDEINIINNELIDGISHVINTDYDRLFEIRIKSKGTGE